MRIRTVIFGKKVRKPNDIRNDVEFEEYALEMVEPQANNFIENNRLTKDDIVTYKVRIKHAVEKVKREVRGGQQIVDVVDIVNVRIFISFIDNGIESTEPSTAFIEDGEEKKPLEIPDWAKTGQIV